MYSLTRVSTSGRITWGGAEHDYTGMERPCYVLTRSEQGTACGHGEARLCPHEGRAGHDMRAWRGQVMSSLGQSRARHTGMERPGYVLTRAEQGTTYGHGEARLCPH